MIFRLGWLFRYVAMLYCDKKEGDILKVFTLTVSEEDFDYDEIADAVVLAMNPEQAIQIAKQASDVTWEVVSVTDTGNAQLIASYIHHG